MSPETITECLAWRQATLVDSSLSPIRVRAGSLFASMASHSVPLLTESETIASIIKTSALLNLIGGSRPW
jgi:hypothetical protein